jgi:uncharacterized protein (DUF433 family)
MAATDAIDWSERPGVEIDSNRQSAEPAFAGARIPVNVVTNNIEMWWRPDETEEILDNFRLTRGQLQAELDFLRRSRPLHDAILA